MREREGRRSAEDSAEVAQRGAPALREREHRRSSLRQRPPLHCGGALPALRLRSPPRCTGALVRAVLALSAALHWRSPPRYASARLRTATALSSATRWRFTFGYASTL